MATPKKGSNNWKPLKTQVGLRMKPKSEEAGPVTLPNIKHGALIGAPKRQQLFKQRALRSSMSVWEQLRMNSKRHLSGSHSATQSAVGVPRSSPGRAPKSDSQLNVHKKLPQPQTPEHEIPG